MKIAILAPSPVPFNFGGAENVYQGLFNAINGHAQHNAELIKIAVQDRELPSLIGGYARFMALDLSHFDAVISLKYPAWGVTHHRHIVYMQHKLRGLYDTYAMTGLPQTPPSGYRAIDRIVEFIDRNKDPVSHAECVIEFMNLLHKLLDDASVPRHLLNIPSPLSRVIVHYLDALSLSRETVTSFNAISQTVARRPQYFPIHVAPKIIYHPSSLRTQARSGGGYFFTVSRLERAKRVDVLIEAYRKSAVPQPFLIAGAGPDREYFEDCAKGDERIRFLGRVGDAELVELYRDAMAVLFAPYDEDFGLIALEGMSASKPVITTSDSGGPAELIEHGATGFVREPNAESLAEAIASLGARPTLAEEMGRAARDAVAHITWENLVSGLIDELPSQTTLNSRRARVSREPYSASIRNTRRGRRRHVVALCTFGGWKAQTGGPIRLLNIYRRLALDYDVSVLIHGGAAKEVIDVAPGYQEMYFPLQHNYSEALTDLSRQLDWVPVSDVGFALLKSHATEFVNAAIHHCSKADAIILEHPYLFPAIADNASLSRRIIVDEHNVEILLKRDIFPRSRIGRELLSIVQSLESETLGLARAIVACSEDDANVLSAMFRISRDKISIVPNGVDCSKVRFTPYTQRKLRRFQLGIRGEEPLVYFIGSWHGPNIDAANQIINCARLLNDFRFVIGGQVGEAIKAAGGVHSANVVLTGKIDEETHQEMLSICDVGVNAMETGSGTNLKIFEYAASGAPILTTPFGIRGSLLQDGRHAEVVPIDHLTEGLLTMASLPTTVLDQRTRAARRVMEESFDWSVISEEFSRVVKNVLA